MLRKKEAEQGNSIKLNKVHSHDPDTTGVSFRSIKHILCEYKKNLSRGSTLRKKRPQKKLKTELHKLGKGDKRRTTENSIGEYELKRWRTPMCKTIIACSK